MKKAKIAGAYAEYWTTSRLAPKWAGVRAARLWCLLPSNAGRRKDFRPYPGTVEHVECEGRRLAVEIWGEGPAVYLQHGWGGWRGQLGKLVDPLVQAGFRVIAGDSMSHGESEPGEFGPRHSTGGEIMRSFQAIVAAYGRPHAVIGHSLGCAAIARSLADGMETTCVALIAPSPDMRVYRDIFARKIGLSERSQRYLRAELEDMARLPMAAFDIASLGSRVTEPALVLHDTKDKESPYELAKQIESGWPTCTFITTTGLGHQRILLDAGVVARVTTFVSDAVAAAGAPQPATTTHPAPPEDRSPGQATAAASPGTPAPARTAAERETTRTVDESAAALAQPSERAAST